MQSEYLAPINLGQDRMISIDELVEIMARIADKKISSNTIWLSLKASVEGIVPAQGCAKC